MNPPPSMNPPHFVGGVVGEGGGLPEYAEAVIDEQGIELVGKVRQRARLPMHDLEITSGGFDGDMVAVRSLSVGLTFQTRDADFLKVLAAFGGPQLQARVVQAEQDIRARRRARWIGMVATALLVLGIALFFWKLPSLAASAATELPLSVDQQLGDAVFPRATAELGPPVVVPEVEAFLAEVVGRLSAVAAPGPEGEPFEFEVMVYESELANAFALPGGKIVVLTGLLEQAASAEQVAGVIAHEMAHVTQRHSVRNAAYAASSRVALALLLGTDGWAELAGDVAGNARENAYSREQESAADLEGVRMLAEAGIDPEHFASFFELLQARGEGGAGFAWLSTHPDHSSRIAAIREARATFPSTPRPLSADWAVVRGALGRRSSAGK